MLKRLLLATSVMVLMIWSVAYPATTPAVSGASGTFTQGQTFTVSGSNFGTGDTAPLLWDDFESGANGYGLNSAPKVGAWELNNSPLAQYSTTKYHSGSKAAYAVHNDGAQWSNFNGSMPDGTYFYGSFWFMYSVSGGSGQTKLNQVHGTCGGSCAGQSCGDYNPGVMTGDLGGGWWNTYVVTETPVSGSCMLNRQNYVTAPSQNAWHRFEWVGKQSSVGTANGSVTIRIDGQDQLNAQNIVTRTLAGQRWEIFEFFTGMTNFGAATYTWIDDAYLNNSWARVEVCDASTWSSRSHCEIQIPSSWSASSITATVNRGSFGSSDPAYLYVVDSTGAVNSSGYRVTFGGSGGGGSGTTDSAPTVAVSSPTTTGTYSTAASSLSIAGTASDDKGVTSVTWTNSVGGSGTASNASGSWSSWSISSIPLQPGTNVITVKAADTAGQTTSTALTVTSSASTIAWAATQQTGDGAWKNSGVTRCVRLLVQGASVTQPASKVKLGFQGRTSGSYTISKVSVAQRDANAAVGNVLASTWTKVAFDGHDTSIWATDVITVPAGTEKVSDVIPLAFLQGQDYYVTFNITSPSVYLDPPSGYIELYFDSADNTQTVQWAGTGYLTTQDYHGLATIHYAAPPAPTLRIGN